MREIGLSDVRLASPPCFPLSWETDNVSVHLSADYPVIWHQCHSLSQHNTPLGPLVLAWSIYGLSSSPNCKNTLSFLFHRLLSISNPTLFGCSPLREENNFWKAFCIRKKKKKTFSLSIILLSSSNVIIKFAFMLNTMRGIISCACMGFLFLRPQKHIFRY